jgi:hypothetical protein
MKTGWYLVYPDGDKHFVSEWRWAARLSIWVEKQVYRKTDPGFIEFLSKCKLEKWCFQ